MTDNLNISNKGELSKWVMIAALLFNVFSFSGYISHFPNQQQQAAKTEMVAKPRATFKRTIFFKGALQTSYKDIVTPDFYKFTTKKALLAYNKLSKTKFDYVSKYMLTLAEPVRFFHLPSIPQAKDHDLPNLFRG